ncbi:DUF397 domain-containing protein [Streptomyces antimycoticus]|uniref:DUF397 domain-containing protein n=1 Tax=Streptomyces antimycoticus TaxID=68175 RepID=UPI003806EE2F
MRAFTFRKSSHSNAFDECVEVATNVSGTVAVRDSKDPEGPVLRFTPAAWAAFQAVLAEGGTVADLALRKSSYSNPQLECVEVATNVPNTVAVRDSKDPEGRILRCTPAAWQTFAAAVRRGLDEKSSASA